MSRAEENKPFIKAISNIREVLRQAQDDILNADDALREPAMFTVSMITRALTMAAEGDYSILKKKPAEFAQNDEDII